MTLSDKTSGTIKSKSLVELLNHKVELKKQLIEELKDMYEVDMDVGITWGERCREELLHGESKGVDADTANENDDTNGQTDASEGIITYNPPTTRYSQPIRNFPMEIISNAKYQVQKTHKPKSIMNS